MCRVITSFYKRFCLLLVVFMAVISTVKAEPGLYKSEQKSLLLSAYETNVKQRLCIQTGRIIGAAGGSMMGVLQIYWSATGMSGVHGPVWKNVVTGVPGSIIGGYTGYKMGGWLARRILHEKPKPVKAILKGALYGGIAGAVTFTAEIVPILMIGHYMGTIDFNLEGEMIALRVLGAAVLGGIGYGGAFGIEIGAVGGLGISLYMKF